MKDSTLRLIFGLKVRQTRMEKNISLTDLARQSGISASYINEIEKGKKYPKPDKIQDLATVLGVSQEWLESPQLNPTLAPLAELLQHDFFNALPLDVFGIDLSELLEAVAHTPSQLSAFISTLFEITRNYAISVENFYFAVLRSYQEMHQNYFEDIEQIATQFATSHPAPYTPEALERIFTQDYHHSVRYADFGKQPELNRLRSIFLPEQGQLLINQALSPAQRIFTLAREIGYQYMNLKPRAYTSTWLKIDSFAQLLNNFKASYFAGALLIPQADLAADIRHFFALPTWQPAEMVRLIEKYQASPEMFLQRLTNLLPRILGLPQLFFLRFQFHKPTNTFALDKELHLAGAHNPHSNMVQETYCRRWVALNILRDLEKLQITHSAPALICQAQRSIYYDSDREYLCFSVARATTPTPQTNHSVTLGLLLTEEAKAQIKFWEDPQIITRRVGVTCQRCSAMDCQERESPPIYHQAQTRAKQMQGSLAAFLKDWK